MNTQYFTHKQAQSVIDEIRGSVPLEVELHVTDVAYNGEFQYALVCFGVRETKDVYHSVCTCSDIDQLRHFTKLLYLMSGFKYPPEPMENELGTVPHEKYAEPFDPGYIPVGPSDDFTF